MCVSLWSCWVTRKFKVSSYVFASLCDHVVVLPAVSHLEHELLPQVRHRADATVTMVDDGHDNGESVRQTVDGRRLELTEYFLRTSPQAHTGMFFRWHFIHTLAKKL